MRSEMARLASDDDSRLAVFILYQVTEINRVTHTAMLVNPNEPADRRLVKYKHLVLADGARRKSLVMLGEDVADTHSVLPYQVPGTQFAVYRYQCRGFTLLSSGLGDIDSEKGVIAALQQLQTIADPENPGRTIAAWNKPWLPYGYTILGKKGKITLHVQIPDTFFDDGIDEPMRQRLLDVWSRRILVILQQDHYSKYVKGDQSRLMELVSEGSLAVDYVAGCSVPPTENDFTALHASRKHDSTNKQHLDRMTTSVEIDCMKHPVRSVDGHTEVFIADAAHKPLFVAANGLFTGLKEARDYVRCMNENNEFDVGLYKALSAVRIRDSLAKTQLAIKIIQHALAAQAHAVYSQMKLHESALMREKAEHLHRLMHFSDRRNSDFLVFLGMAPIYQHNVIAYILILNAIADMQKPSLRYLFEVKDQLNALLSSDDLKDDEEGRAQICDMLVQINLMKDNMLALVRQHLLAEYKPISPYDLIMILDAYQYSHYAFEENDLKLIYMDCVANHADVDGVRDLITTCGLDDAELIRDLLHINDRDLNVLEAMYLHAVFQKFIDCFDSLCDDSNRLFAAADKGYVKMVDVMLRVNPTMVDCRTASGQTVYQILRDRKRITAKARLLPYACDLDLFAESKMINSGNANRSKFTALQPRRVQFADLFSQQSRRSASRAKPADSDVNPVPDCLLQ